jgi:exonuclease III
MGRLFKPVLGRASGKVGDIVFRYVNGKVFITSHKGTNKISKSTNCVNNRLRFSTVILFAKTVNKLPDLKYIWAKSRTKGGTGYSKIISKNIKSISQNNITTTNVISPSGFFVTVKDVALTNTTVSLSFLLVSSRVQHSGLEFKSNFLISFSEPVDETNTNRNLVLIAESNVVPSESDFVETSAKYNNDNSETINMYKKAIVFFAITRIDTENKVEMFSNSSATEIML